MGKNFKRFLSWLMVLTMVLGLMPATVFATEAADDGGEAVVADLDFTDATGDESGEGWTWSNETKTLTLSGVSFTSAVTLPEDSTIVAAENTVNTIVVEGATPVTTAGKLTINGSGSLTVEAVNEDEYHTVSGAEEIVVENTSLTTYGFAGLNARNVTIKNAVVNIRGYGYGIFSQQTTGSTGVILENVSGSIVGELCCGIDLYVAINGDNSVEDMDNAYVSILNCDGLTINGELEREKSSSNGHRSGILVYTKDAQTNAYVQIKGSNIAVNGSGGGIQTNAHSDNSPSDDAAAAWVTIEDSTVDISTITDTWAAIFVNNNGTGAKATSAITINDSKVKALCPNDVGVMTSTKDAASIVTVKNSTLDMSGAYAGIRAKAITSDAADIVVESSVVVVTDGIASNYVGAMDEMDNAVSCAVSDAEDSAVIVPVYCEITANSNGTWNIPAGGTVNANGTEATYAYGAIINADGTITDLAPTAVAQVGETKYASLSEAVAAANAIEGGATVKLLKNVTLGEKLTISGNVTIQGAYTITRADDYTGTLFAVPAGATLTLDGNLVIDGGNNWSYKKETPEIVYGGDSFMTDHVDAEENAPNATGDMIVNAGTLNLNKVTIQNSYTTNNVSVVYKKAGSVTTLDGATIRHIAGSDWGIFTQEESNSTLTMKAGSVITDSIVAGNGAIIHLYGSGGNVFNMEGGSINNNYIVTTTGRSSGTVICSWCGDANNKNQVNISGGIIENNHAEGYGPLYIHTNTVFNMSGGEVSGNSSYYPNYVRSNNNSGSITGGKIVDNTLAVDYSWPQIRIVPADSVPISGGQFEQDVLEFLAPNYGLAYNAETGIHTVTTDIAEVNGVVYNSIDKAAAAANDGDTVKVLVNHKVNTTTVIEKNVTLDFNGKTMLSNAQIKNSPVIRILADVTITGNGKIDGRPGESCYAVIVGNSTASGNLTAQSGIFYGDTSAVSVTKGKLTINGGNYAANPYVVEGEEDNYNFVLNCIDANYKNGTAVIEVKGGNFYKFDPANNAAEGTGTSFVADGYYSEEYNTDFWTVKENPATQVTVTVGNATMVAGNPVPTEFTYTTDVEGVPALNITYTVSGTTINATVAEMDGYEFTVVPGTLTVQEAVAKTGDVYYADLQEAINAATNGETVLLLKDITYTDADKVNPSGANTGYDKYGKYYNCIIYTAGTQGTNGAANTPSQVNAVLDLNGHTITNTADETFLFILMDNTKLTIKGEGTIHNGNYPAIWTTGTDTLLTIEGGKFTTTGTEGLIHVTHASDMVITGGEFDSTANEDSALIWRNERIYNNANSFQEGAATVSITGGTFYGFNPEQTPDDYEEIHYFNAVAENCKAIEVEENVWYVGDYVKWIKAELLAGRSVKLEKDIVVDGTYIDSISAPTNGNGNYYNPGIFNVVGDVEVTFDLNGHSITYNGHADAKYTAKYNASKYNGVVNSCTIAHGLFFANNGAKLTIKGEGNVTVNGMASGVYAASPNSAITVEGGSWENHGCAECGGTNLFLYASHGGEVYIKGGTFAQDLDSEGKSYLIVEDGGDKKNEVIDYSLTKIEVTGGTFVGMNPEKAVFIKNGNANAMSETNVVKEGYKAVQTGENTWIIVEDEYTLVFDFNGGTNDNGNVTETSKLPYGTVITLPAVVQNGVATIVRDGYVCTGFNTAADGSGTAYTFGDTVTITGDITLYAQWTEAVARIGDVYYATLADAYADAAPKARIDVLKDIVLTETLVLDQKSVSIYMKSWNLSGDLDTLILVSDYPIYFSSGGKVTNTGDVFRVEENGRLNIYGGCTVTSEKANALYVRGGNTTIQKATLVSNGEYPAIQGNGNYAGNVYIQGGSVSAPNSDMAIYWPGNGELRISGGTITGDTAVYVKSGKLNITGGEFRGTGEKTDFAHNSNGAYATGDAVVIENCKDAAYETPVVSISGGKFASENAEPVAVYNCNTENDPIQGFITGGTYNKNVTDALVAEGYYDLPDAKGEWWNVIPNGCVLTVDGVWFESFDAAKAAITKNSAIVLYADVVNNFNVGYKDDYFFPSGGSITLELNGFQFHSSNAMGRTTMTIGAGTTLTVTDSVGTGSIVFDNKVHPLCLSNNSKLYLPETIDFLGTIQLYYTNGQVFLGDELVLGQGGAVQTNVWGSNKQWNNVNFNASGDITLGGGSFTLTKDFDLFADRNVVVPKGVTLDLAGNDLTVKSLTVNGTVIDSTDGQDGVGILTGSLKVNGHANGGYMPISVGENQYQLYAMQLVNQGIRLSTETSDYFGFSIQFQKAEAYDKLTAAWESGSMMAKAAWTGEYENEITKIMGDETVLNHLAKAKQQLVETGVITTGIGQEVIHTNQEAGDVFTCFATIASKTGFVISSEIKTGTV